jgi:type I restriction enzyme S subunit
MTKEPIIRHVSSILAGTWGDEPDDSVNTVACLRVADFDYSRLTNVDPKTRRKISQADISQKMLKSDDILIEKSGGGEKTPVGRAVVVTNIKQPTTYANFIERVRLMPSLNSRYANYALSHLYSRKVNTKYIKQNTGIQNLDVKAYLSEPITIPSIKKQEKVVDYLDTKTQTLDKILAAKNHTHTHLSELRQAIITNAVLGTGGATMSTSVKNTWVGATPDHWKITKLSHVARIKTGGTPSRENLDYWTDGNIPWLASGEVNKGIIATVDNHITPLGMANSNATILPIDTVMIALNGQGKTKGMAALLKVPATCNQSLAGVICDKDKINPRYLYYYLKSKYSNIRGIKGEARDGLNLDIIGSISVPLPPMEEQLAIIEQIERRINKIDKTEVKLSESIKLLEEYRSSLISNVVGGKVEV